MNLWAPIIESNYLFLMMNVNDIEPFSLTYYTPAALPGGAQRAPVPVLARRKHVSHDPPPEVI